MLRSFGLLAILITVLFAAPASAQPATGCSEFQVYWEALLDAVPDDTDGKEALVKMIGAGELTRFEDTDYTLAVAFVQDWHSQTSLIEAPVAAELFHAALLSSFETNEFTIDYYADEGEAPTFYDFELGIYVLLLEDSESPRQCAA